MKRLMIALCLLATPLFGQEVAVANGAVLRVLDRVSGQLTDIELANGAMAAHGHLEIILGECRYPSENPSSDAFSYLTIRDTRQSDPVFSGWMVASSPALNALDHPRYDVWVMRCNRE